MLRSVSALAGAAEGAGYEDDGKAGEQRRAGGRAQPAGGDPDDGDPDEACDGEPDVVDEKAPDLLGDARDPAHQARAPAARRPRALQAGTLASAIAPKPAISPRIARSSPGQATPMPSPSQKAPKPERMTPTVNFSVFSGTCAIGRCRAKPNAATMTSASAAPALAGSRSPAPPALTAITMNTTSVPSIMQIWNAAPNATASKPAPRAPSSSIASRSFA